MTSYLRFGAMVACSTILMYVLMYLNTYQFSHIHFSQTRAWMALVMGSAMAMLMLAFMRGMFGDRRRKLLIVLAAATVFAGALALLRSQHTVDDLAYMRAMIPHHSIAIMTSERAQIRDARVRALADGIAATQRREIGEMNGLIADIAAHGVQPLAPAALPAPTAAPAAPPSPSTDSGSDALFDGWDSIIRVVVVGILAYGGLVLLLRISGNRTLSKLNAFDLVVTVAFGSTLATILVSKSVSLAAGMAALALLVVLQLIITWCSVRFDFVSKVVTTAPTLLLRGGVLLPDALLAARVTADDVRAVVRQQGHGALAAIDAVVLESDGSLSVIAADKAGDRSAYGTLGQRG